jgi:hypothetical protein
MMGKQNAPEELFYRFRLEDCGFRSKWGTDSI